MFPKSIASVVALLPVLPLEAAPVGPNVPHPPFRIDYQKKRVERVLPDGWLLWSVALKGQPGGHREPDLLWDALRVYAAHGEGVTAFARDTGKELWTAPGPSSRLFLTADVLLAVDCTSGEHVDDDGRWCVARSLITGNVLFRVALPVKDFDPLPIRDLGGAILIQSGEWPQKDVVALAIDTRGKVLYRSPRFILDGVPSGKGRVLLTTAGIIGLDESWKQRWEVTLKPGKDAGRLTRLPGGDLLAHTYCPISDSGVRLLRTTAEGKPLWSGICLPLGVDHSKYRHSATVAVDDGKVTVTSVGSFGTFVETLDLATGRSLARRVEKD
jgi:hypothetical protein